MSRALEPTVEGIRQLVVETLEPDDQLPSEQVLTERFSVSRATVREAITRLESAGLVEKRWGVGTFVAQPKPLTAFGLLSIEHGIPGIMSSTGSEISVHRFDVAARPPDPDSFPDFPDEPTASVVRVLALDGVPTIVIDDHLVASFDGRDLDFSRLRMKSGVMQEVLADVGLRLAAIDNDMFASDLDERGQRLLGMATSEPVIETLGVGRDQLGRQLVKTHIIYRTKRLRLRLTAY